ncbi:MAG: hypothetical protein P0120_08890 [Nitrospira sp.]|nr:hypothetical protein [Nitrospira sp.]
MVGEDRVLMSGKELRLAGVTTLEDANRFLEAYLPRYNRQLVVPPGQTADLHRPLPLVRELERSVCLKTTRCLRKDFTIAHKGRLYTDSRHDSGHARAGEEQLDGILQLTHQGRALGFHAIAVRPAVPAVTVKAGQRPRRPIVPKPDHPWRKRLLQKRGVHPAAAGPETGHSYFGKKRTFLFGLDRLNSQNVIPK